MVIESLVGGGSLLILSGLAALTREVYLLKGKVENGLTDKVDHIEERVDDIYDHLIGE